MAEAKLRTRADLDATNFDRGIARMRQGVKTFAASELRTMVGAAAAAFSVHAIKQFAVETAEAGHRVSEMSKNLRIDPSSLQALEVVAATSGASIEVMDTALARLQKGLNSAAGGNTKMTEALKTLGLSPRFVAQNMDNMGVIVETVFKKVANSKGDMAIANAAGALLGKQYIALNETMVNVARDGLGGMTDALIKNNEIMNTQTVNALANMTGAYEKIGRVWDTIKRNFMVNFAAGSMGIYDIFTGKSFDNVQQLFKEEGNRKDSEAAKAQNEEAIANAQNKAFEAAKAKGAKILDAPMKIGDVGAPVASDQYSRMGLFSGGNVSQAPYKIAERQMKVLEEMRVRLDKANELLEEACRNTAKTADNLED